MSSDSDEVVKKADGEEAEAKDEAKADEAEAKSNEDAGEEAASSDEASAKDEPSEEEAPAAAASNGHADAHAAGDHASSEEEPALEEDRPRNGLIAVTIVTTVLSVVLVLLGIREVFRSAFIDEVQSKVLGHESSELRDLRAQEKAKLGRYQWVSKKDGVVRIPLERAMALTLVEYKERAKQAALAPKPEAPKADTTAPAGSANPDAKADAPKQDGAHGDAPKQDGAHGDAPKKQDAPKEH